MNKSKKKIIKDLLNSTNKKKIKKEESIDKKTKKQKNKSKEKKITSIQKKNQKKEKIKSKKSTRIINNKSKSKTKITLTTSKKNNTNPKNYKNQKGGSNIATAAIGTIKSMIGLGVNIGKEIDAIMHMGRDFNKATDVKLPNQTTPDQSVTDTNSSYKNPEFPKAKV